MDNFNLQGYIASGKLHSNSEILTEDKKQGYDDREDESLGARKGAEKGKKQSMKDRRDDSYGKFGKRDDEAEGKTKGPGKNKVKKESLDNDLAEIDRQAQIVAMEAKLDKLSEVIGSKSDRINMVTEDDNLSELVDKKKMKEMQREVKILEKKKAGMEKMYEKLSGKSYKMDMPSGLVAQVDETEEVTEDFDDVVDDIMKQGKSKKEAEKIAGAINAKYVGNYRNE